MSRPLLSIVLVLAGCGASESARSEPAPAERAATPPDPAAPASTEEPSTPATAPSGPETCEGLVGMCGGWEGCVHVRPDRTAPERFVGVGDDAGRFYAAVRECFEGACNDMCWPDGSCRPGVRGTEGLGACSGAIAPGRAPYHCVLTDGHCVRAGEVFRPVDVTVRAPADCTLTVDGQPSSLERTVVGELALFRGTVDEGERRFACSGTSLAQVQRLRPGVPAHVLLRE